MSLYIIVSSGVSGIRIPDTLTLLLHPDGATILPYVTPRAAAELAEEKSDIASDNTDMRNDCTRIVYLM